MGEVYRARDPRPGREVAIKIRPHPSRMTPNACAASSGKPALPAP
jgi:hypothetical protein